jgi:hypothetical protein
MRLWTYQTISVLHTLQSNQSHYPAWPDSFWKKAYHWMWEKQKALGYLMLDSAPVWAWHSVKKLHGKPDEECGRNLLSDIEIAGGIALLEMEVPDHLCLLSRYDLWNEMMEDLFEDREPPAELVERCFKPDLSTKKKGVKQHFADIQATLPYLDATWLMSWEPFLLLPE